MLSPDLFYQNYYFLDSPVLGEAYTYNLNEGINSLHDYIKATPSLIVSQLTKKLNIPSKTLERWIKQLRDEDKIEYSGSKKSGGYFVK